jgi:uncharacterized protein (DUF362 family)
MSSVSFVKSEGKTGSQIKESIAASLNLIDYKFPSTLKNVAIKPNMCYYWDFSTGQTTDPRFVSALIDLIREQTSSNVDISIIESDASAMRCNHAYKMLGYEKLSKEKDVKLVNLSEDVLEEVDVPVDGETLKFNSPKTIQSADLRINVPKIKFMGQTTISCAMKNIFGCNPQVLKYKCHPKINETIVGLNKLMKFDLHILDGLIVSSNPPKRLKLVMAGKDPVAFDAAAARILGVNPGKVKHLNLAQKEGLGTLNFVVKGESWQTFAKEYPKPSITSKILVIGYKTALKVHLLNPESM